MKGGKQMKKMVLVFTMAMAFTMAMVFCNGCLFFGIRNAFELENAKKKWDEAQKEKSENISTLQDIERSAKAKGYMSLEELDLAFRLRTGRTTLTSRPTADVGTWLSIPEPYIRRTKSSFGFGLYPEACNLFNLAVTNDYLPFRPMFYLAIEKENFDEAELIRRSWINTMKPMREFLLKSCKQSPESQALEKINIQIDKLSIVGLADPTLVTLRKELMFAFKEKKWHDAQDIQNLITARVNELRPPPQVVQIPGGQTPVIVSQESPPNHIQVEHVPRYGATDVGRAVSLLQGRGGKLTGKEAGTLMFLDILMKR
jgi:hypothetical protein